MPIQLFVPTFDIEACLTEIRDCLEKGWTGLGYKTLQFEDEWKEYTGLSNAHFLNSATAGLNLAFDIFKQEFQWNDNDEVITTPITFVSSNHAILLSKLKPIFADIDDSLCLDPESIESKITLKTKAVMFVGLGGNVGEYLKVSELCKKYNLKLILDAAHMAGTRINGIIPGKEADVVVYSFQAVKNLPTADSGMICFSDANLDKVARKKTWLGINKDTFERTDSKGTYKWKYDVEYVGQKYHGNSIMAAIGIVQLKHLDRDNSYRREIAGWYDDGLSNHSDVIKMIRFPVKCIPSRHLYQIIVENRDGLMQALNEAEIYPGVHYLDNTRYRMYSYAFNTCPNASYVSDHIISLPLHLKLSDKDVQLVISKTIQYIVS